MKKYLEILRIKISLMWYFSAHENQLSQNNIVPIKHSTKLMNEPIILTRDEVIKSLSNVCTHRGMIINTESTKSNVLK